MSYGCTFKGKCYNGDTFSVKNGACYSGYYKTFADNRIKEITVYILKDYTNFNTSCKMNLTEEEVIAFTNGLNEIWKVHFKKDDILEYKETKFPCYSFTIDFDENHKSSLSCMMLLNIIRYMAENPMTDIAKAFAILAKKKSTKVSMYNRFVIAQTVMCRDGSGHNMIPNYGMFKLLTDEEVKTKIVENTSSYTTTIGAVPSTNKKPSNQELDLIKQMINEKQKCVDIFTKYQEICAQYM